MIEAETSLTIARAMTDTEEACKDSSTMTEMLDTEISEATIEMDTTKEDTVDTMNSKGEVPK